MTTAATIATRLTLDTSQYATGLKKATRMAETFALTMRGVGSNIAGWGSGINSAVSSISSGLKSAGSALTMGVTLPLVAASVAVGALGVNAVQTGAKFDTQMKNIQSISKQTDGEIQMLGNEFLRMSENINVTTDSATKLAEGFYFIQSSGFAGADGMEVLRVSTKAATAGLSNTETAGKAIISTLNAYGLSARDAEHVSDVLFKTVDLGVLTFDDLANQLGDVVNTGATVGVSIETIGAALAQMTRKGVSTSESVTALNQLMLQFISPSEKMKKATEELGLGKGFLSLDTLRSMGLEGALQALVGADPDALLKVFGDNVRALKGALTLGGENMPGFTDMLNQMGNVAGRTSDAFATQTKSLEAYGKNIKNIFESLKISFAQKFGPGLTKAMGKVSEFLTKHTPQIGGLFIRLAEIWDKVVEKFVNIIDTKGFKIFEFFNTLIDALPMVWQNIKAGWEKIQPALEQLFGLFKPKADPAQQASGIMTFILALGALGPVLSTLGTILPLLGPIFLAMGTGVQTNGPQIVAFFQNLATQIPLFLTKLQEIGTVVGPVLQRIFDIFMSMDPNTMLTIVTILGSLAALAPVFMGLGSAISFVSTAYTVLSPILTALVTFLTATAIPAVIAFAVANAGWLVPLIAIIAVVGLLYLAFKNNWLGIRDIVMNVALSVGGFIAGIVTAIANLINKVVNLQAVFANFRPPSWVTSAANSIFNNLPGSSNRPPRPSSRDSGGMGFAGQPYAIGTGAQPELFVPSTNGHFTPNAGGGSGGDIYNIVVNNPKKESTEQSVRRALKSISYTGAVAQ